MPSPIREIEDASADPAVRGFLHLPDSANGDGLVLTHGAGSDSRSRLLTALAGEFASAGFTVLRCDLPYRQKRPHGPPFPGSAVLDRQGLRRAVAVLQQSAHGRIFLGGHSYGGRQASMLASEDPQFAAGLLLLSYPLHPPNKPDQLRTAHFPQLQTPALFVHGSRDPFASEDELNAALQLIPATTMLLEIAGGTHDLLQGKTGNDLPGSILQAFQEFFG
ncbi:MAG TPA: alpha/beta fold hydrolase [Candidatus Angelobacter sp.]|nr:alpha/beta fold hydrolase [Candidatus Angelobacter sp.]